MSVNRRLVPTQKKRTNHMAGQYASTADGDESSDSDTAKPNQSKRQKQQKTTTTTKSTTKKKPTQSVLPFARPKVTTNANGDDDDDNDIDVDDKLLKNSSKRSTTTTISITKSATTNDPNRVYGANVTDRERTSAPSKQKSRGPDRDAAARALTSWAGSAFAKKSLETRYDGVASSATATRASKKTAPIHRHVANT